MDVQGPRGLGIGMRVVALGRAARRRGAGEWQERRPVRCGLGIRIAILIAISDTLIPTARRHCSASAERTRESDDGAPREREHRTAFSSQHSGYGVGPTTHPVYV